MKSCRLPLASGWEHEQPTGVGGKNENEESLENYFTDCCDADALQESFNKCLSCIDEEPDEERQKTMKAALKKLIGIMDGQLE